LNLKIVRANQHERMLKNLKVSQNANMINKLLAKIDPQLINAFDYPLLRSQLGQEIFVLGTLGLKRHGYFVEFGATDGLYLSNSYVLEKEFGWTGICAEPARIWHKGLQANRNCAIDFRCIYSSIGKITFKEAQLPQLSTISDFQESDFHRDDRKYGYTYDVETISLGGLLSHHRAPKDIDYVSIDTEGSEFKILENFNFKDYSVSIFTIEHNFTSSRKDLHKLLVAQGYTRVLEEFSEFEDWYVHKRVLNSSVA
jgi:FkbM family methyltransferase